MIKVLVVEDSPVAKELIVKLLDDCPEIEVVGTAETGEEAINLNEKLAPHVITMDVNLPKMNGLEATQRIMESHPTPIIIVSSGFEPHNIDHTIEALRFGAVAIAKKPEAFGTENYEESGNKLIQMIKLMSEIKVIKRTKNEIKTDAEKPKLSSGQQNLIEVIGIGASTGGPLIIEEILSNLPANFKIPVIIVQHIARGFTKGFIDWLNLKSSLKVVEADDQMKVEPGNCYIAPDDFHLTINSQREIQLLRTEKVNGVIPSVSVFFDSLGKAFAERSVAVLLSGMGKDGAEELKVLKELGAITIAQDSSSSVIYGMPGEAAKLNAARYIMSKENITSFLTGLHYDSKN